MHASVSSMHAYLIFLHKSNVFWYLCYVMIILFHCTCFACVVSFTGCSKLNILHLVTVFYILFVGFYNSFVLLAKRNYL